MTLSPDPSDETVVAKINFLVRAALYETVKPYTLRYKPEDGFPQTNVQRELCEVTIHDLREKRGLSYEKDGFIVAKLDSIMRYEDYENDAKIEGMHWREVRECVRKNLEASSVEVLDYVVRRRDPEWPIAKGGTYESQQPASAAHIDHTFEEGCRIIRDVYGEKAGVVLGGRWQCVNAWHPLQGPLKDWPLAVCSATSVDYEADTMAGDVVDRDAAFENTQVHFNPEQKWYYLPGQMPDELLIFKNADSEQRKGGSPGAPHASFDNPLKKDSGLLRESIELRLLVRW